MEQKISIDNLVIEVTRKCNLTCEHCLRGDAQNLDLKHGVISDLFEHNDIDYISTVTFTGGEVTLNIEAINRFIDTCNDYNVNVGSFYIVINGVNIPNEFITTVARLYAFCDDNEISQIQVSESDFYFGQDIDQIKKLELFKIFSRKPTADHEHLILQGRAVEWANDYVGGAGRMIDIDSENQELLEEYEDFDKYGAVRGTLYLNVNGDILGCCDLSYESQDAYKLGNVKTDTIRDILKELNKEYNAEA